MKKFIALLICCVVCFCSPASASQFTRLTSSVAETDPQVGATDAGEFCVGDGSAVQCNVPGALTDDDLSNNVINDLSDVTITADSAAQILVRNAGDTAYENVSVSGDVSITAAGVATVADNSHSHTASNISDQNAGTDITADLEEETHATEHNIAGADTLEFYGEVQDEDTPLTRRQFINFEGAGVSCSDDTTKTTCTISGSGSATITVEEGDSVLSAAITTLDFALGFDTTESPAGEANISLDLSEVAGGGDLTWVVNTPSVSDDSHNHTGTTLSGIDISDDTNLAGDAEIVLTNDTLSIAASIARDAEVVLDSEFPVLSTTPSDAQILIYDTADSRYENKSVSGDLTITAAGVATIGVDTVALTTDTTGNYVANVATTSPLAGGSAGSEGASLTLSITADGINATQIDETANFTFTGSLVASGTNPTVATGGLGIDTTNNQLVYSANVLDPKRSKTFRLDDITAADDNFLFWNSEANVTITDIACKYVGTGSTPATFTLEDDDGNAMTITGTNPTCTAEGTDSTFAAVTASNTLASGEGIRFDVTNTPAPTTDDYIVTVKYTTDRT